MSDKYLWFLLGHRSCKASFYVFYVTLPPFKMGNFYFDGGAFIPCEEFFNIDEQQRTSF